MTQVRDDSTMSCCPTLEHLVLDLHKSREIANKHLANFRYSERKIGLLNTEIKELKVQIDYLKRMNGILDGNANDNTDK